ncbi:SMP-30/gluconolactonase/LRE family protein [Microbacterium sp. AZCO]|uniref:SMP-30/gluconolactonase/LRE family protein n=1 Tax=Microbacterium sp. AZCO TaxID=3142976 RepID=UPI0031F3FA02
MDIEATVFRTGDDARVPEGLWWDDRTGELVWVDIPRGTLHRGRLDGAEDGSDDRVVELPAPLSAVQPAADGGYVAALRSRIVLLDADGQIVRTLADIPHAHQGIRFNDGKVDPYGRFVVGAIDETTQNSDAGVYAVDVDGAARVYAGGFNNANGLDWSAGGDTWYISDTSDETVYRTAYGPYGAVGPLEPFLVGRSTDGLTLDADGVFWGGVYGEGIVQCWDAEGREMDAAPLPAPAVTSVAFGGPDLDVLFAASAREGLSRKALGRHPLSGAIFRLDRVGTGRPVHAFGLG